MIIVKIIERERVPFWKSLLASLLRVTGSTKKVDKVP